MRRRTTIAALAAVLSFSPLAAQAAPASADGGTSSTPRSVATSTSSAGVDPASACGDLVQLAPVLSSDHTPDGKQITPKPTADGRRVPVIIVHGWVSYDTHSDARDHLFSQYVDRTADPAGGTGYLLAQSQYRSSLIGMLQQVPGAEVYTFDYSQVGSRWVTDPQIGPKLSQAIECLSDSYQQKPVLVTHSMGGLVARQALSNNDSKGRPISGRVSNVLAVGAPNNGSDSAQMIASALSIGSEIPLAGLPIRMLWDYIGQCSEQMDATNTTCTGIRAVDAFRSSGGEALRTGSAQLAQLPWWPDNVKVTAYVGDIQMGGISLFGLNSPRLLDLGDLLVSVDSAKAGSQRSRQVNCEYGIISTKSAETGLVRLMLAGQGNSVEQPADLLSSPCFHEAMLHETTITGDLQRDLTEVLGANTAWHDPATAGEQSAGATTVSAVRESR